MLLGFLVWLFIIDFICICVNPWFALWLFFVCILAFITPKHF